MELEWNFEISGWSWSGILKLVGGVGVGAELKWPGVELELMPFFNSDSTPIDSVVELIFQVYITLLHKNNKPANH